MCEYCNTNEIDRIKANAALQEYRAMDEGSIILIDDVLDTMSGIYGNNESANYAVRRVEYRNVKFNRYGELGVLPKDVVSELENMLFCRGETKTLLDG